MGNKKMNSKGKGSRNEKGARKILKELGYSLLGVVVAIILIVFVICMKVGAWFISPLECVRRKWVGSEK